MPIKKSTVSLLALAMLAGCATGNDRLPGPAQGNAQKKAESSKEKRLAVQALKKAGIYASNLAYWQGIVARGCYSARAFSLPLEDAPTTARQLEQEFGPVGAAFATFYAAAELSEVERAALPKGAGWQDFVNGFNSFKAKMAAADYDGSQSREEFLAMLGGVMGDFPRWQLWYADRLANGLTLRSFLAAGRESEHLIHEHWKEAEQGRYLEGNTRGIFGESWQPKGWSTANPRAVQLFSRFLSTLADGSIDAESRGSQAVALLKEFGKERSAAGTWSTSRICEPQLAAGLQGIQTPEDYRVNDKETAERPQGQQHRNKPLDGRLR